MRHTCSNMMAALLVACLIVHAVSCSSSPSEPAGNARAARGVLKVLGIEYARFVAQNDGRPPADKGELAAFLETRKDRISGLKEIEQLFISPRDSEPLLIFYGESMPPVDESGFPLVAREASGVAGQCLAVNTRGGVQEIAVDRVPPHLGAPL